MVIAIVCDVLGEENNGTSHAAMNLIRHLRGKGYEVRIICPDEDKRGLAGYYIVPKLDVGPLNKYVKKNGVAIARADREILEKALKDADAVHIMTPFLLSHQAALYCKEQHIPITAGFHCQAENVTNHLFLMNSRRANNLTYSLLYDSLYRYADAIHYPTQFIRDVFESRVGPTNGYVISNGVNRIFREGRAEKPAEWEDRFVILFSGRFSREKSHRVLIDAAALLPHPEDVQLVFAGAGPLEEELSAYAQKKLPNPPYMHFFAQPDLVRAIHYSDLYVHPAEIEIEAIACLEALSCGLVPVISDSPRSATRYFALDQRNLFRCNDEKDLARKIRYWMDHPREKAEISRAYVGYARQFDQERCMEEMEAMILETARRVKSL